MNRDEKEAAVAEMTSELEASTAVFAVNYRGISVPEAAALRARLGEADASFNVVKNRLAKLAVANSGDAALDEHLVGPTAFTYVRGDAVLAAKAISDFIRRSETISYKGGIMEGSVLDPDQFKAISRLPGVDVLRGQLVGLAATPLSGLVRTLNQLVAGLASQLGQIAEQGLVSGEAPVDAPAEASGESGAAEAEVATEAEKTSDEGEDAPADGGDESDGGSEADATDEVADDATDDSKED